MHNVELEGILPVANTMLSLIMEMELDGSEDLPACRGIGDNGGEIKRSL